MAIKDDYIKIRVSKEQKALFKDIAKKKNISMSKFIIVSTEERALREKEKFEGIIDMGDGNPISTDMFQFSKGEHGLLGFIQLTLSPTNVSFKKIKIIERDGGLRWEGKNSNPPKTKPELANEHKTCNLSGSVGNKNHFYDMVGDNRLIEEIIETIKNSKYNPQKFWFVCKLYVHRGHGGE